MLHVNISSLDANLSLLERLINDLSLKLQVIVCSAIYLVLIITFSTIMKAG